MRAFTQHIGHSKTNMNRDKSRGEKPKKTKKSLKAKQTTGGADQWVLKRRGLPGFAIVNEKKRPHPWDTHHHFSIKTLLSNAFKIDLQTDPPSSHGLRPTKNRESAFRNMMRKFISDLWKGQLYNAARTHAGQGRKTPYIQIAKDDLQRLNFFKFKPAQFLRIHHNQLPLLRLRNQSTSYISTHLHLSNTHTYTPYAQRYCLSCLPLQILGDETHTLIYCPHSFPLAQPAIHSLMFNFRQFDLRAWATYADTQKVAVLLGSIPPKLDRQQEKAWGLLTFPTGTQLIYSLQSHSRLNKPPLLPFTSLPATISFSPPPEDIHCQVRQSHFEEHQMLLCNMCNAGWHMDHLLPPFTAIPQWNLGMPLTPITRGQGLPSLVRGSSAPRMGGLGTSTQTDFSLGFFSRIFFPSGLVLADRSPPSPRVDFRL